MNTRSKKNLLCSIGGLVALIMLVVGFMCFVPNGTTADAAESEGNMPTNIPGIYVHVSDGEYNEFTVDCTPPFGYEFVSFEVSAGCADMANLITITHKGGNIYDVSLDMDILFIGHDAVQVTLKAAPLAPTPLPPNPTKEGYTFTRWYFDEALTRPYDNSPIYGDITLYAGWQINTYTVTFNSNEGSAVDKQTVNWNTSVTLSSPTKLGYTFVGWFLVDGTKYTNQPIKANTRLLAKWEAIIYTVTFKVDNDVYKTLKVPYGTTLGDAVAKAEMTDFSLKSLSLDSGASLDSGLTELSVTDNMTLTVEPQDTAQKVVSYVKKYWYIGVIGIVVLALLISLTFTKKRKVR